MWHIEACTAPWFKTFHIFQYFPPKTVLIPKRAANNPARCGWLLALRDKSEQHGIMQIPGPEGFIWRAEAGLGERLSWPLCTPLFINQQAKNDRAEESNSIPVPVPAAPPSAQRSWTDQPECGEHCYFNSFSSSCSLLDGAILKVRLFFLSSIWWFMEQLQACCASGDSPSALVAQP